LIRAVNMDAERYVAEKFEKQIRPPEKCPHCCGSKTLWALGYYVRNLSRLGIGALRLVIRRFRCHSCGKTVSILPAFAQPYRFVQNTTIESYVCGSPFPNEVIRNIDLLSQYWRRFSAWLPEIERTVGNALGRAPPRVPQEGWEFLLASHDDLGATTQSFASAFQITLF
jgi:hypothetical protein